MAQAVVVGAGGGLGRALASALEKGGAYGSVIRLGRGSTPTLDLLSEASIAAAAAWVAGQGIDRGAFEKAYRSFSVQLQTKRAEDQSRKVRLPSVPSLVVDGKYLVPIADDGDFRDQLALVDALIERARREKASGKAASP